MDGGRVETIVGKGLFDFGDRDGRGDEARLQHAYDVTWLDGRLYAADAYNNKIKVVDPATREARTLLGTGEAGYRDGTEPLFWEPEGIAAGQGMLYIANTNNHRVRVADLASGRVESLVIEGL